MACEKRSGEWFVLGMYSLSMLAGFIFDKVAGNLMLLNSFTGCFSTSFRIYFQSFRGFLIHGASRLAGFCVVRVFVGVTFKQA